TVHVTVLRFDSARARLPVPMVRNDYLETGADGSFEFFASAGPFELRVADDRFAATCLEVDPAHEPVDDVKIVVASGTLVALHVAGKELSRERILVEDPEGRTVASRRMTMGAARFTLRPGKYVASATLNGEELARADFEVGDTPLDVALEPRPPCRRAPPAPPPPRPGGRRPPRPPPDDPAPGGPAGSEEWRWFFVGRGGGRPAVTS